jgi:ABC-type multidrug transport system fused ATPase/permease subunit
MIIEVVLSAAAAVLIVAVVVGAVVLDRLVRGNRSLKQQRDRWRKVAESTGVEVDRLAKKLAEYRDAYAELAVANAELDDELQAIEAAREAYYNLSSEQPAIERGATQADVIDGDELIVGRSGFIFDEVASEIPLSEPLDLSVTGSFNAADAKSLNERLRLAESDRKRERELEAVAS